MNSKEAKVTKLTKKQIKHTEKVVNSILMAEWTKAHTDALLFGNGYLKVDSTGILKHVPFHEVFLKEIYAPKTNKRRKTTPKQNKSIPKKPRSRPKA